MNRCEVTENLGGDVETETTCVFVYSGECRFSNFPPRLARLLLSVDVRVREWSDERVPF